MREIPQQLLGVASKLKVSSIAVSAAREKSDIIWAEHVDLVVKAYNDGLSLDQIANVTDVSKSRIWQIVRKR